MKCLNQGFKESIREQKKDARHLGALNLQVLLLCSSLSYLLPQTTTLRKAGTVSPQLCIHVAWCPV